ncbi:MAG: rod-binding protein [Rhodospirillaceae bacterium]|nr:rod-binding protein [Rhodospirillaceae bacterium]
MDSLSQLGAAQLDQARAMYAGGVQARLTASTTAAGDAKDAGKVRAAAQEFEAFFIGQMMQHMWTDVGVDPEFGGGHAEEMWRSMLTQEYGKEIAKRGGFGIADQVMAAMIKAQEERSQAGDPALQRAAPAADTTTHPAVAAAAAAAYRR